MHHFSEAIKAAISEDVDLYHRNAARMYSKKEDLKNAIPHYKDAYKYGEDPLILFYLGRAADGYYKDKQIAIRYYQRYLKSPHDHEEYKEYCTQRIRYLREIVHQQK